MGRAPCCDKANVKKGPWSPEEDAKLKSHIDKHGTGGNWITLPQKIGLKRCGKSCRLRWLNYLRPNIKHGGFTEDEDNLICTLYITIGSRWSIIAAQLPGRTDNDIKNYWNTKLKKKLLGNRRKQQQARLPQPVAQPPLYASHENPASNSPTTNFLAMPNFCYDQILESDFNYMNGVSSDVNFPGFDGMISEGIMYGVSQPLDGLGSFSAVDMVNCEIYTLAIRRS
ncbi:hypothetical protein DH2020_040897 [Rehmannia glutinosa]|uniref:R2R3-MYB protein n=1 Tax=Rehmannia glutinosa TaxID=99300 RepID=A0ABR0USC6_REHGL